MGWASYQEDNMDARGESKSSKSRKPEVPNRDKPLAQEIKKSHSNKVKRYESSFRLQRRAGSTRISESSRPKLTPDTPQRIYRKEPLKIQHVTTEVLEQRILAEIIRQQEEEKHR